MRGIGMNLSFGLETVYEDANFLLHKHDKVGIVGVNGAGKTTLFRVLLKQQALDSGCIVTEKTRIGYLPQEIELDAPDITVFDYLLDGRPIRRLEAEFMQVCQNLETAEAEKQPALLAQMATLQEQLEYYDCYEAENILLRFIDDMQIDCALLDKHLADLSGGQKSKVAFARTLYSKPEILLLDEPTNHLDVSTKAFVTKYLQEYAGMVLMISHDVEFLDSTINRVLFINKATHKILLYDGNYTIYKKKYALEQRLREQCIVKQETEIKEMAAFVQKAKQASPTNHRLKSVGLDRAAKLEKKRRELQQRDVVYKRVSMRIQPKREGAKVPLEVQELSFHYPGQLPVFKNLSFSLAGKERFLVVGENGVGKSTLLKLLVGLLQADSGNVYLNEKTDIAYYAQELEVLDPEKSILENVDTEAFSAFKLRTVLGNFLFHGESVFKKVAVLSPGEKARVALCKILLQQANTLILDEPTNHLDPETQAVIGENFNDFAGTILVVSHNPMFVRQIGISRMLVLPSGRIENYSPELLDYYYRVNTQEEQSRKAAFRLPA